jgi:hypothetical protein
MSTRTAEELLAETKDGVRVLTLNRPEALNALTPGLLKALGAALKDAAKDRAVRCVVLTGAGKAFCAGADLSGFKADGGGLGEHVRSHFNPAVRPPSPPSTAPPRARASGWPWPATCGCSRRRPSCTRPSSRWGWPRTPG